MTEIKHSEIAKFGINSRHEIMDNGEMRFRLKANDGSGYIRTVTGNNGAWQNSHYHPNIIETYIVQKGWLVYAELKDGKCILKKYNENDIFSTVPGVVHNIYLPKEAVIHTVKHGEATEKEWIGNKDLDKLTKVLSEQDILKNAIK